MIPMSIPILAMLGCLLLANMAGANLASANVLSTNLADSTLDCDAPEFAMQLQGSAQPLGTDTDDQADKWEEPQLDALERGPVVLTVVEVAGAQHENEDDWRLPLIASTRPGDTRDHAAR